ncbi:hypothetical protein [Halorubellus litoreus]|uniref:HEAT repeat n=1 Tax=Halorubellus litoreus TaxID=755308 RepID=A0ABD5VM29_9EURY
MTHEDVIDRIDAARERDRSFAGLQARAAAARAAASADRTETAAIEAVAGLLDAELDTPAAESERITGLDAIATDVESACVDALTAVPRDDSAALAAALPVLARATHRGRTAAVREAAAEECLHAMVEPDAIPADAVPISDLEAGFAAGERDVRRQLAATRRGVVGNGGVFEKAAGQAPERAPGLVRWLLRFEDFELVDNRLSFEWGVARALESLDDERASAVLDVVLDHLAHENADYRRTAAGALSESHEAVPEGRVGDVLDAVGRRFDDEAFGVQEDAVAVALALLERVPGAAERTFDRLRTDVPAGAVVDGLRELDEADPAVRAPAVEFLLDACDGEATGRSASRLGNYLLGGGTHRWTGVGRALVAGAVAEAAADDAGRARASSQVAALAPGVDGDDGNRVRALAAVATDAGVEPLRVFVALVPPPESVDAGVDPGACLRDVLSACLRAARAPDSTTRQRARLAAELLADVIRAAEGTSNGDDSDHSESEASDGDATAAVCDALRAVRSPGAATSVSVAARTRVVAALPVSARVQDPGPVAGLLAHTDATVRERAVDLLATGRVDASGDGTDELVGAFGERLTGDVESVRGAAVDAAPAVVDGLPAGAAGGVVDGLLERAGSEGERTQRRAIAALVDVADAVPGERVEQVATVALLGLQSADTDTRSVAADLLAALGPRLSAERAPAVAAGVVAATEAYADVVFDGLDVLWALAEVPGTGDAVARAFARTLAASRVARDHLADASVGFEATPAQVRRVVDGLLDLVAADDADASADAATALDVVATTLPADRIDAVVDALATAATGADAAVRSAAYDALESVATVAADAPASTWTPLGALFGHEEQRVRRGAIRVLTRVLDAGGDPSGAADSACDAATDSATPAAMSGADGDGTALEVVLVAGLSDPAADVRVAASRALGAAATAPNGPGTDWAIGRLCGRTADDAAAVRQAAVEGIRRVLAAVDAAAADEPRSVRDVLADRVAEDPDAAVREAAVAALLGPGGAILDVDGGRARLDDAAAALEDHVTSVRETAVEALPGFLERIDASLGLRSRAVIHLEERIEADESSTVRRRAAAAASDVLAAVVDDYGAYEYGSDEHVGEYPPASWLREALSDVDPRVHAAVVDRLPAFAPTLDDRTAGVAVRKLVVARRAREGWPTDGDLAALTALVDRLDPDRMRSIESHIVAALSDAEGERLRTLAVALAAAVEGEGGVENDVVETLLDRIATARKRTGHFGERVPSPQADSARDVLVDLVETSPEAFGKRVDAETLRFYVGHDREAVRAGAAAVLAAVVEHGDDPRAAVATRDDLRASLTVDVLSGPARLAVLAALADGTLLARTHTAGDDR